MQILTFLKKPQIFQTRPTKAY